MNKLSTMFGGASAGGSLLSNLVSKDIWTALLSNNPPTSHYMNCLQSPMAIPQIAIGSLIINPDIMDLDSAESAFENYTSP